MKTGKLSESVLKRSVLRQIKTKRTEVISGAGVGADCAVFALPSGVLASCVQAGEVTDAGGAQIRRLLIKCANNLAASGAEPVGAALALTLPADWEEPELRRLTEEAEQTCRALRIQITGGHTMVSASVRTALAAVTGYGMPAGGFLPEKARPGQDIVVSKWIGLEGTAELAGTYRQRLTGRYPAHLVEEAAGFDRYLSIVPEAAVAVKSGVRAMHDASEGGIFAALWELAERAGAGLSIDLRRLPIRQETVEVCECCGVNPYELLSGGSLVMAADDGEALAAALAAEHIPAAVVGKVTEGNDRIVKNEEEIRYLDRPRGDEIYRARE